MVVGLKRRNVMNSEVRSFRDLNCWKDCRELRLFIAKQILPVLPASETYRLKDQILRAARSTTANIAEGYGRFHYLDNAKFCSNCRGSLYEVLDHLITANDEDIINDHLLADGEKLVVQALKTLNGYISYLQKAAKQNNQ